MRGCSPESKTSATGAWACVPGLIPYLTPAASAMRGCRFGFETSATMTAGLWAGSTSLTADFATVIWRMQLLGFNTIRLPFSFQVLPSWLGDDHVSDGV